MIKIKYISKVGKDYQISPHFTLGEFQSHDGADMVKYSTYVLSWLEKIRARYGGTIRITSGYRSPSYNARVGGASNSAHLYGQAADFKVTDSEGKPVSSKRICLWLEAIDYPKSIGFMGTATHLDSKYKNRMDETHIVNGNYIFLNRQGKTFAQYWAPPKVPYMGLYPRETVSRETGSEDNIVLWQKYLKWYGYKLDADGKFGTITEKATMDFQKVNGLRVDGSVGTKTIAKARAVKR